MPLPSKSKIIEGKKVIGKIGLKKVIVGGGKPLLGLNGKVKANVGKGIFTVYSLDTIINTFLLFY